MPTLAVTAVGADRPGIIARVTEVLLERGGNLEDSSMTVLGGHFAIMLLVRTDVPAAALEDDLSRKTIDLGLTVTVREVGRGTATPPASHVLAVYGTDRPGILHHTTSTLAEMDINVRDVSTRVIESANPVYAMLLEVTLPEDVSPADVEAAVNDAAKGVEVSVSAIDPEVL